MNAEMSGHGTTKAGRDGSESPPPKRHRAKQACEPCRLRKRRCDGSYPCNMCTQFEYKCYFEKHPRKRSKIVEQNAIIEGIVPGPAPRPPIPHEDYGGGEDVSKLRAIEANSGIAFTRLLGLRLDPNSGSKLFMFGWNVGSNSYAPPKSKSITDVFLEDQIFALIDLYIAHIHPLYGFLDRNVVVEQLSLRWAKPALCTLPDHLFTAMACLGALFSSDTPLKPLVPELAEYTKISLESPSLTHPPGLADIQTWLLRCLYLRSTDNPQSTWMATCVAMHLVESTGIHQEATSTALHPSAKRENEDAEIRRRTFWMARMLNTWVSFEHGRTRVAIRSGITAKLPTPREGDHTCDYVNLYSLSCCLDPERTKEASQWDDFLRQVEAYEVHHDAVELSKAQLGLAGYRRLRLTSPSLSTESTNRVIRIGLKGLEAAQRVAETGQPWWHVANVPFQVICAFLAMDTRESLQHIATAMRILEFVTRRYNTVALVEALKTARFLVRLSRARKQEDSDILSMSLKKDDVELDPQPEVLANVGPENNGPPPAVISTPMTGATSATSATSSSEEWNLDLLNASDFDWNSFLTADMPAFDTFAPDGIM